MARPERRSRRDSLERHRVPIARLREHRVPPPRRERVRPNRPVPGVLEAKEDDDEKGFGFHIHFVVAKKEEKNKTRETRTRISDFFLGAMGSFIISTFTSSPKNIENRSHLTQTHCRHPSSHSTPPLMDLLHPILKYPLTLTPL